MLKIHLKFYFTQLICLFILCLLGCSEDENNETSPSTTSSEIQLNGVIFNQCDQEEIDNHPGTICCISGPLEASPNETISLEYSSNLQNPSVTWEVVSGELSLVNSPNSNTATFDVLEGFSGGSVKGYGDTGKDCSVVIEISLK